MISQNKPLPLNPRQSVTIIFLIAFILIFILIIPDANPSATWGTQAVTVPEGLTASEWTGIQAGIRQAEYQFTWHETTQTYRAPNPAQGFDLAVRAGDIQVSDRAPSPSWELSLALTGYGVPDAVQSPGLPTVSAQREYVFSRWNGVINDVTEGVHNTASGLEHSFILPSPQGNISQIDLKLTTTLVPRLSADGQSLLLQTPNGKNILRYDTLRATDANGNALPAHFLLSKLNIQSFDTAQDKSQISILIQANATPSPITVSILLHDEVAKILANDADVDDQFGSAVAISGDTVVVGAYRDDDIPTGSGAAYVFTRNQEGASAWGQVLKLTASDADASDLFGWSVAISGDTIAIGARDDEALGTGSGSAYLYARNQNGSNNWGEVIKIVASDGANGDQFGYALALDGDTLVVGAPNEDTGQVDAGKVYIFRRNQGGADAWGELTNRSPGDPEVNQQFGFSVGVSGETIIVGAYLDDGTGGVDQGSAYLYTRNQGGVDNWGFLKKITASDSGPADTYGYSVAISSGIAVVGARFNNPGGGFAQGAAYLYARNWGGTNNWGQVKKLVASDGVGGDIFGNSVAVDGDTVVIGAASVDDAAGADQGAVYVFRRNEGGADNWGENAKLIPVDAATGDRFGDTVAVSGNTLIGGAPLDDDTGGVDQGSAYLFVDQDTTWEESAKPTANDANANDAFGYSVAVSGDFLVIGSRFDDTVALDTGSAYIFERNSDGAGGQNADNWGNVKKITASDANANDQFGWAVTISGNTLAVGANLDDGAGSNAGAVYLFTRNQGGSDNWGQVKKITATGASADDQFGFSISLSRDTLIVGAPFRDGGAGTDQGTAYIFSRNQGGGDNWGQVTELVPSLTGGNDQFGFSVSISGGFAVAGAPYSDTILTDQGAGFVFHRNLGGAEVWGQAAVLLANDAEANDNLGYSLAISGDTIVAGVPFDDDLAGADQGSASIFARNAGGGDTWGFVKRILPLTPAANDQFGISVAIDVGVLVVGANGDDDFGDASGALTVFERNVNGANQWGEILKLTASDAGTGDAFGSSVALSGKNIAVGAPAEDGAGNSSGAAYIFQTEIYIPPTPLPTSTPTHTPTPTHTATPTTTPTSTNTFTPTPTLTNSPGPSPTPTTGTPTPPGDFRIFLPILIDSP